MRTAICLAALSAMVAAVPYAQVDTSIPVSIPATVATTTSLVIPTTSLNIPITETWPTLSSTLLPSNSSGVSSSSSRRRGGHSEPIPIFSKPCDCPNLATVAYPCYATDALARCNFEENFSWVCWTSAFFGCPSPTRTCEDLYKPTPITGRHPCELGPNPEPTPTLDPTLTITSDPSPVVTSTAPPTITAALYDPALKGF